MDEVCKHTAHLLAVEIATRTVRNCYKPERQQSSEARGLWWRTYAWEFRAFVMPTHLWTTSPHAINED